MNNKVNDKNNFILLTHIAALFVLISQAFAVLQVQQQEPALWYDGKYLTFGVVGFNLFFTVTGYCLTESLFNSDSQIQHIRKQFFRCMPALVVATMVFFALNWMVSGDETMQYLLQGAIPPLEPIPAIDDHFVLPKPFNMPNSSFCMLHTPVAILVVCYLGLIASSYYVITRKWLYLACFVLFQIFRMYISGNNAVNYFSAGLEQFYSLSTYFLLGSLLYCFKDDVRFKWFYANILMALAFATVYTRFEPITLALFFSYCFIIIGVAQPVFNLKGNDVSYGLYLYGLPIQQLVAHLVGRDIHPWLLLVFSAPIAILAAIISWRIVEKPVLESRIVRHYS